MAGYTPQAWADFDSSKPLSAARMLTIEDGIYRSHPQVVTSLPTAATPFFDGEEVVVRVPGLTAAYEAWWTFRHDSANASTEPWAYVGGAPIIAQRDNTFATASTVFIADGSNDQVTVPFKGWYRLDYGFYAVNTTSGAASVASPTYGAAASAADQLQHAMLTGLPGYNVSRSRIVYVPNNAQIIQLNWGTNAGTASFSSRWLSATPIRCGP